MDFNYTIDLPILRRMMKRRFMKYKVPYMG
jgi:hypothetical protein